MSVIEEQIEVDVPLRTAYDQWTQFETFPHFMEGVERVEQRGDTMTHWVTRIGGATREFNAQIVDQVPDQQVSWRVTDGPKHDGTVMFLPHDGRHTVVRLAMEYEPEGVVEKVGDAVGLVRNRVREDLERFKQFIEARGVQSGGWRGEVSPGDESNPAGYGPGGSPESGFTTGPGISAPQPGYGTAPGTTGPRHGGGSELGPGAPGPR